MLRSVIETSREILIDAKINKATKATHIASPSDKNVMLHEEVGVANMSDDAPVMGCGAKEPYLVDVNREETDVRWLRNQIATTIKFKNFNEHYTNKQRVNQTGNGKLDSELEELLRKAGCGRSARPV